MSIFPLRRRHIFGIMTALNFSGAQGFLRVSSGRVASLANGAKEGFCNYYD